MAFQFTLRGLLRVRQSLEKAEWQRLQALTARAFQIRAKIESLDKDREADRRQSLEAAAAGVSGAELRFEVLRETVYQERRGTLMKQYAEVELQRREQQKRYMQVRQQREILTNLRKRQYAAYQLEQARREQQQIDELFLMRRGRTANSQ